MCIFIIKKRIKGFNLKNHRNTVMNSINNSLQLPYDVELFIYRLIHNELTFKLNEEYISSLCKYPAIPFSISINIQYPDKLTTANFLYNYRDLNRDVCFNYIICSIFSLNSISVLPNKYSYSSGSNDLCGFLFLNK